MYDDNDEKEFNMKISGHNLENIDHKIWQICFHQMTILKSKSLYLVTVVSGRIKL